MPTKFKYAQIVYKLSKEKRLYNLEQNQNSNIWLKISINLLVITLNN